MTVKFVDTDTLTIAYEEHGPADGAPVILLHGFPYDPRGYDEVVPPLADGNRVLVPYLRGYGPTRFRKADTPRSGQQAALGNDLLQFMNALGLTQRAALAGFDWGGRAACIVSALWPERVRCLVSCTGYNLQNIAASVEPVAAEKEHRLWYQYYFHTERGRAGLTKNRRDVCRLLWKLWSPNWKFDEATFERSAAAFDNPDFVDVVIQSYRHRFAYAPGDPALEGIEAELARTPKISVPTINLHGGGDGVGPAENSEGHARFFSGPYERRVIPSVGHNVPQEAPAETAAALRELMKGTKP